MKIELDLRAKLLKAVLEHGQVEVTIEKDHFILTPCEKPENLVMTNSSYISDDLVKRIVHRRAAIVGYDDPRLQIYTEPLITILHNPESIKFLNFNKNGTPIFEIDGVQCKGYMEASQQLFGERKKPKELEELLKPFLYKEFNVDELFYVRTQKGRPPYKDQIIYKYKSISKQIRGSKGLKREFPQLTDEDIKGFKLKRLPKPKERHEILVEKYDIVLLRQDLNLIYSTNLEKDGGYYTTKKALTDAIKAQGETISRDTHNKMHQLLEGRLTAND